MVRHDVFVDGLVVGKQLVVHTSSRRLTRMIENLRRDGERHGRGALLDIYRSTYKDLVPIDHARYLDLDERAQDTFCDDIVFTNALRAALFDIPVNLYRKRPLDLNRLQRPGVRKQGEVVFA